MAYLRTKYTPNASYPGTLGDVTLTGTQTLTNKTLTTPTVGSMANYTFPNHHIVQVVTGTTTTETSTTSNTYEQINAALEPSITVTGSNKVWVTFDVPVYHGTAATHQSIQCYRGVTALGGASWGFGSVHSAANDLVAHAGGNVLDTPGAGSHTYKLYHRTNAGTGYSCINATRATITLFEIVA